MDWFRASLAWGGPWSVSLAGMLQGIERGCVRAGTIEAFHTLCHEAKEAMASAGVKRPIQQWYLEPVAAPPTPSDWTIEERFTHRTWTRRLRWHDPTGRSRVEQVMRAGCGYGLRRARTCGRTQI